MLKAGIFLDMENLMMNGGWGMKLDAIKQLVEKQGTIVLRANTYLAVDLDRERSDREYRDKRYRYRDRIRRDGFHIIEKEVKRYRDSEGNETTKANADLDMAVDAILQSENLDYVMIGSGDGDFLRLIRAIQNKGKRVDALAFDHVSNQLKREVDYYFPGSIIPGILPIDDNSEARLYRGILGSVNEDKGFGFIETRTGFGVTDIIDGIFCHISNVHEDGASVTNSRFAELGSAGAVLQFEKEETSKGVQASNITIHQVSS